MPAGLLGAPLVTMCQMVIPYVCACTLFLLQVLGSMFSKFSNFHQLDDNILCAHVYMPFSFYIL